MTSVPDDLIRPFQIEGVGVRGRLVRLGPALDEILGRHDYPDPVAQLLGEAVALSCVLASALKFDGIFTLQTKGDGPISTLVADYRSPGDLRGYAQFDSKAVESIDTTIKPQFPVSRVRAILPLPLIRVRTRNVIKALLHWKVTAWQIAPTTISGNRNRLRQRLH